MLFLIFIVFVALFIRSSMEQTPEIIKVLKDAHTLPRGGNTSPHLRCNQMGQELGVVWQAWAPQAEEGSNFVPPTCRLYFERQYFGPMDMEVAGDQVLIYDMLLSMSLHSHKNPPRFQTVISFKPPELRLPTFIVRPRIGYSREDLTSTPIKTDTALDMAFDVESFTPHRVKALFQSELGSDVLIPFLVDRKWTVEWNGDRLIIYEPNRLIAPQQIAEAALEASEFFECLKSGPEVVDRMMKTFFETAISKR